MLIIFMMTCVLFLEDTGIANFPRVFSMVFPIENGPHFQSTASPASLLDSSMASLGPARLPHELPLKVKDGVPLRRGCDPSGGSC